MQRALKILPWIGGGILVLFVGVGVAAYLYVSPGYVRAQIENRANAASGRKTEIGKVSFSWGLDHPRASR